MKGGCGAAAIVNLCPAKPFVNFVGNKLTCGRDNFPLIQDVSTRGLFDPNPSTYRLCVYKT